MSMKKRCKATTYNVKNNFCLKVILCIFGFIKLKKFNESCKVLYKNFICYIMRNI